MGNVLRRRGGRRGHEGDRGDCDRSSSTTIEAPVVPPLQRVCEDESSKRIFGSAVKSSETLLLFDFDCTLSSVHLFHTLRTASGMARMRKNKTKFYRDIFGGDARMKKIRAFLEQLSKSGFTVYVLSFGNESEIRDALKVAGALKFVSHIYGNTSYTKAGIVYTRSPKLKMISLFQRKCKSRLMLFVDDDRNNFPLAQGGKEHRPFDIYRWGWTDAGSTDAKDRAVLILYPAGKCKDGDGLNGKDMDHILNFLRRSVGSDFDIDSSLNIPEDSEE